MKPFDQWVDDLASLAEPKRMVRVLTDDAQAERDAFEAESRGCACHLGCAPCSHCTHPGNPLNQEGDESAWVEVKS